MAAAGKAAVAVAVVAVEVKVVVVAALDGGSSNHFNYMTLTIANIILGNGCAVNTLTQKSLQITELQHCFVVV